MAFLFGNLLVVEGKHAVGLPARATPQLGRSPSATGTQSA